MVYRWGRQKSFPKCHLYREGHVKLKGLRQLREGESRSVWRAASNSSEENTALHFLWAQSWLQTPQHDGKQPELYAPGVKCHSFQPREGNGKENKAGGAGAGAVPLPGLRPSPLPELCSSTARARPAPCPPPSQLLLPCPAGMTPCLVPSPCLAASCCTSLSINTNCAELSCWSQGQLFCHLNGAGHFGGEKGSIYLHDTGWMFYHSPEAGHNFFHHFLNGNHRQCSQWSHKSSRNNDKAVGSLVTWQCCSLSPVKIRAELAL